MQLALEHNFQVQFELTWDQILLCLGERADTFILQLLFHFKHSPIKKSCWFLLFFSIFFIIFTYIYFCDSTDSAHTSILLFSWPNATISFHSIRWKSHVILSGPFRCYFSITFDSLFFPRARAVCFVASSRKSSRQQAAKIIFAFYFHETQSCVRLPTPFDFDHTLFFSPFTYSSLINSMFVNIFACLIMRRRWCWRELFFVCGKTSDINMQMWSRFHDGKCREIEKKIFISMSYKLSAFKFSSTLSWGAVWAELRDICKTRKRDAAHGAESKSCWWGKSTFSFARESHTYNYYANPPTYSNVIRFQVWIEKILFFISL